MNQNRSLKLAIKTKGNKFLLETDSLDKISYTEGEVILKPKTFFRVVAIRQESEQNIKVVMEEIDKSSSEYKKLYASGTKAKELINGEEKELPEPETNTEELEGACAW